MFSYHRFLSWGIPAHSGPMQVRPPLDTRLLRHSRRGGPGAGGRLPNAAQRRRPCSLDWNLGNLNFVGSVGQHSKEAGNQLATETKNGLKSHFTQLTCLILLSIITIGIKLGTNYWTAICTRRNVPPVHIFLHLCPSQIQSDGPMNLEIQPPVSMWITGVTAPAPSLQKVLWNDSI